MFLTGEVISLVIVITYADITDDTIDNITDHTCET
jgi:hypothetical protein